MPSSEIPSNNPTAGTPALVRIERINGAVFAIFTDPNRPGFEYDPSVHSWQHAQEIGRHMADKRWITLAHLEQFAALMRAEFGEAAARG